jgi:hypothetical protein
MTPTKEDVNTFTFYVRLSGEGTSYFDELVLEPKE